MRIFKGRGWSILAVLTAMLLILAAGCANLGAIRSFAERSSDIAGYTKLVNYYVDAPQEMARYRPAGAPQPSAEMEQARKKQKQALMARHKIIQTYMDALGQLAADEVVVYDKEVTALGNALKGNQFMDQTQAAAFTALGKLVARAATDAWRQGKLKEIIREGNAPVQALVKGMQTVVEKGYAGEMENLAIAIGKYYGTINTQSSDPAGKQALLEWRDSHLAVIATRHQEAQIYAQALGRIAAGHQELYDNLDRLDAKDVLGQMKLYAKYLRDAKSALASL